MKVPPFASFQTNSGDMTDLSLWLTDFEEAKRQAAHKNRILIVNVTGSDWCMWCKKLEEDVFSSRIFLDWAPGNAVLLKIDRPETFELPAQEEAQNQKFVKDYNVSKYPTILVMDGQGHELIPRLGYRRTPEAWINELCDHIDRQYSLMEMREENDKRQSAADAQRDVPSK